VLSTELGRRGCPRIYTNFHGLAPGLLSFAVQYSRRFVNWEGRGKIVLRVKCYVLR